MSRNIGLRAIIEVEKNRRTVTEDEKIKSIFDLNINYPFLYYVLVDTLQEQVTAICHLMYFYLSSCSKRTLTHSMRGNMSPCDLIVQIYSSFYTTYGR